MNSSVFKPHSSEYMLCHIVVRIIHVQCKLITSHGKPNKFVNEKGVYKLKVGVNLAICPW